MAKRIDYLVACLAGCIVAALIGLLLLLKFDAPMLAMLSAGVIPALACRLAGITDNKQLGKIAAYASIGWLLTFMLQPAVVQTAASHTRRILSLPLLGYDWHIPSSFVSTLLALVGVCFVPVDPHRLNKNSKFKSESPDNDSMNHGVDATEPDQ